MSEYNDKQTIYQDEWGKRYALDERGNKIPPLHALPIEDGSSFKTYDTSEGHCALCGSLTCNGSCFK